jgi:hypothetical protein
MKLKDEYPLNTDIERSRIKSSAENSANSKRQSESKQKVVREKKDV